MTCREYRISPNRWLTAAAENKACSVANAGATLSWLSSHCISCEDRVPVDFIYGCPIFKWVAVTWLKGRSTRIIVPLKTVRAICHIYFQLLRKGVVLLTGMINFYDCSTFPTPISCFCRYGTLPIEKYYITMCNVTYWDRNKIDDILQTTFFYTLSWKKTYILTKIPQIFPTYSHNDNASASVNAQRRQTVTWSKDEQFHWRIYMWQRASVY